MSSHDGDAATLVRAYLFERSQIGGADLWMRYGICVNSGSADMRANWRLDWKSIQLLTESAYERLRAVVVNRDTVETIRVLARERVAAQLTYGGYAPQNLTVSLTPPGLVSHSVRLSAQFTSQGRRLNAEYQVPVNAVQCPYVGIPRLLTRDLPKP
jgi:hypothetical protein